jgi:hypothetical protein
MNMSFQRILSTAILGLLPFGCAAAPLDSDDDADLTGPAAQALEDDPKILIISMNGLEPGLLTQADHPVELAALANGPIGAGSRLVETAGGRSLLSYLGRCALPSGSSFQADDGAGTVYEFPGAIGLAPDWQTRAITGSERHWVSACLLAHANAYGRDVAIDLQGDHPALAAPPRGDCTAQEAGFYGDVFGSAQAMFACAGTSPSHPDGTPPRICGRTADCGFVMAGDCSPSSPRAVCEGGPDVYRSCSGELAPAAPVTYPEVITVYTRPGTFSLPPGCGHSPLVKGLPLSETCSTLTESVCEDDAYCCETDWDETCVAQAQGMEIELP